MAVDQDSLILTISADTRQALNQLKKLGDEIKQMKKDAEKDFEDLGKKNPLEQMQKNVHRSAGAMATDVKYLRDQFDDMISSIAAGGSPLEALKQQMGEIAKIMTQSGGGLAGGAKLLGTALMSMINPINLMLAGFTLLAYAADKYFDAAGEGSEEAKKALKEQFDALDAVVEKWGDLVPTLKAIRDQQKAIQDAAQIRDVGKQQIADAYKDAQKAIKALLPDIANFQQMLAEADTESGAPKTMRDDYDKLSKAIENGTASAKDLLPVIGDLNDMHDKYHTVVSGTVDALKEQSTALDQAHGKAVQIAHDMSTAAEAQKNYADAMEKMHEIVAGQKTDIDKLTEALNKYIASLGNLEDRQQAVFGNRAFAQYQQDVATAFSNAEGKAQGAVNSFVESIIKAESSGDANAKNPNSSASGAGQFLDKTWIDTYRKNFADAAKGMSDDAILALKTNVEVNRQMIAAYARENADILIKAGQEASEANLQLAHFLGPGGALAILKAAPGTRAADVLPANVIAANQSILGHGATREDVLAYAERRTRGDDTKKAASDLDDWNKKAAEAIELKKKDNEINADSTRSVNERSAAVEEEKLYQEGLNAAIKQYGTVSDDQKTAIRATAHEMAQLGLAADNLKTSQEAAIKTSKEHQEEMKKLAEQITQTAESAIGGFVNDLRNGVKAGEAFHNMLNRIIDGLLDMAIKSLFAQNALGGVIGNLLGVSGNPITPSAPGLWSAGGTVGLSHHSDGRNFSPLTFVGAPRYQQGGFAGLRPGEIPAILHAGEFVVPAAMVGRSRPATTQVNTSLGDVKIDMSQTGMVAANNDSARQFGINVQKMIQLEMVRESRPGGLLRRAPNG